MSEVGGLKHVGDGRLWVMIDSLNSLLRNQATHRRQYPKRPRLRASGLIEGQRSPIDLSTFRLGLLVGKCR